MLWRIASARKKKPSKTATTRRQITARSRRNNKNGPPRSKPGSSAQVLISKNRARNSNRDELALPGDQKRVGARGIGSDGFQSRPRGNEGRFDVQILGGVIAIAAKPLGSFHHF